MRIGRVLLVVLCTALLSVSAFAASTDELTAEARGLLEEIAGERAELGKLRTAEPQPDGEARVLAERRRLRIGIGILDRLELLVENILQQEEQGLDASEYRVEAEKLVRELAPAARRRIEQIGDEIEALTAERDSAAEEERSGIETRLGEARRELDTLLEAGLDNVTLMAELGLDDASEREFLRETVTERAESTAERLRRSVEQIELLEERLRQTPDDAAIEADLAAAEAKRKSANDTLAATIVMMDRLELDTAEYQRLQIETTGKITTDILDTRVAVGLVKQWMERMRTALIENGPAWFFKALIFVLILLLFRLLARFVRRVVARTVSASKLNFSQLLQKTFIATSGNLVMAVGFLVALSQMGFALGPILAGLGIVGFIVGFALQETLGNFAAGMMILIYRPYDVDDLIEAAGVFGKVSAMSMVSTTVLTIDNQTLVIPNGKIWGDVIKNVTAQTVRRVDMTFGVSYGDDIPKTERVLAEILKEHPKVLDDPAPTIKLHKLGESSVDFIVRPWVQTGDYWEVYWDVTREVKMRFDREGIQIPFPQRDVHLYETRKEHARREEAGS